MTTDGQELSDACNASVDDKPNMRCDNVNDEHVYDEGNGLKGNGNDARREQNKLTHTAGVPLKSYFL